MVAAAELAGTAVGLRRVRGRGRGGVRGTAGGILVRAKQIRQRPPKKGFGFSSNSRPHSEKLVCKLK